MSTACERWELHLAGSFILGPPQNKHMYLKAIRDIPRLVCVRASKQQHFQTCFLHFDLLKDTTHFRFASLLFTGKRYRTQRGWKALKLRFLFICLIFLLPQCQLRSAAWIYRFRVVMHVGHVCVCVCLLAVTVDIPWGCRNVVQSLFSLEIPLSLTTT